MKTQTLGQHEATHTQNILLHGFMLSVLEKAAVLLLCWSGFNVSLRHKSLTSLTTVLTAAVNLKHAGKWAVTTDSSAPADVLLHAETSSSCSMIGHRLSPRNPNSSLSVCSRFMTAERSKCCGEIVFPASSTFKICISYKPNLKKCFFVLNTFLPSRWWSLRLLLSTSGPRPPGGPQTISQWAVEAVILPNCL